MTSSPKIAFLVAAHDRPAHLSRLLSALCHPAAHVFLHINAKSDLALPDLQSRENITLCEEQVEVHWGGFSQVEATLALMRCAAVTRDYTHFVFISGSDYPLRPISEILQFFALHRDSVFLHADQMPVHHKPISRLKYYHSQPSDPALTRHWYRIARRVLKPLVTRDFYSALRGRKPYGGTCWWAMPADLIAHILKTIDNDPEFLNFFRNTHCPDEMIFQILVMNSHFGAQKRDTLSWTDWSRGGAHPATVTAEHISKLKELGTRHEYLFARKFPNDSAALVADLTEGWPQSTPR